MRKWLYAAVVDCPRQEELIGGRVYSPGSVEGPDGPGDNPDGDFIVIRFSTNQPPIGMPGSKVKQQRAQVWVHSLPGSMLPLDEMCDELEDWLPAQAPAVFEGDVVMDCKWEDTFGDAYDDHYGTNTRFVSVLITYKDVA
jgi:hypothetical protein